MARVIRCPNPSCGRTSQFGEDPLGRVFRCPRCLTKLPTTEASGVDSGWTRVLGPLPRRYTPQARGEVGVGALHTHPQSEPSLTWSRTTEAAIGVISRGSRSAIGESSEFAIAGFDSVAEESWSLPVPADCNLPESGEIYVAPFDPDDFSHCDAPVNAMAPPPSAPESVARARSTGGKPSGKQHALARRTAWRLSRFEILDVLGEGHHATVYRAFDPFLERQVALKLRRPRAGASARALERFLSEARALARLHHPRIVPVFEAGRDGDSHYIAMALIEGRSLAERIAEKPLLFEESARIVAELAEALAHAHGMGIIHRDVKPANVRIDPLDEAYLMDFGIAYLPDSGEVPTPPGTILGTPAYLAPELAHGGSALVLPSSDQYSLGTVLYEMLCGQPPFFGTPSSVLLHAVHHDPPSPRTLDPRIPRPLSAICRKAMAKQPDERYVSCRGARPRPEALAARRDSGGLSPELDALALVNAHGHRGLPRGPGLPRRMTMKFRGRLW